MDHPRTVDGSGTREQGDLEHARGCDTPGRGCDDELEDHDNRHSSIVNGGIAGIWSRSSRIPWDLGMRVFHGRVSRCGCCVLFHDHTVSGRGCGAYEGSGEIQSGSTGIEDGEVMPDSEEEEGHVEVLNSEEEGHVEVPDSEDVVVALTGDREDYVPAEPTAGDVPDTVAISLDCMEEQ